MLQGCGESLVGAGRGMTGQEGQGRCSFSLRHSELRGAEHLLPPPLLRRDFPLVVPPNQQDEDFCAPCSLHPMTAVPSSRSDPAAGAARPMPDASRQSGCEHSAISFLL